MTRYVAAQYKVDMYHLFIEAGINLLSAIGVLAYITPNTFLKNKHTNKLREIIVKKTRILSVLLFYRRVFEDPSVDNLVFFSQRVPTDSNTIIVREIRDGDLMEQLHRGRPYPQSNKGREIPCHN